MHLRKLYIIVVCFKSDYFQVVTNPNPRPLKGKYRITDKYIMFQLYVFLSMKRQRRAFNRRKESNSDHIRNTKKRSRHLTKVKRVILSMYENWTKMHRIKKKFESSKSSELSRDKERKGHVIALKNLLIKANKLRRLLLTEGT